ncbi:MarR family transcriptional regulator [Rhizobium sp. CC-YZS058]|uniref:MarR family winged helix-turn-helix transcriptional regulator n=1 Tax=Rhizobium sp. CC-YZS058 TaxID=3042153 RepID=UPI002B05A09A|nr:MarR family transcriptional regulator [Rhizobium sp. CC-YZS058]MEA3535384.1 MarR family transcriptional regulator [Rhizobium sp. CC-YZS058]
MTEQDRNRELFDALSSFNRKLRAMFDARVKQHGLTLSRARALFILSRRNGLNQRELASELGIETPTLVRVLDGMAAQGFIERRAAEGDRRAKQVHLTAEGKVAAAEIEALADDLRIELLGGVSAGEKATTLSVLRTMSANMADLVREEGA